MCELISEFSDILENIDTFVRIKVTSAMKDQIYTAADDYNIASYLTRFLSEKKGEYVKVYYTTPSFIGEFYFKDGLLHKEDGAAMDFKIRRTTNTVCRWDHYRRWFLKGRTESKNNLVIRTSTYNINDYDPNVDYKFDMTRKKIYETLEYANKDGLTHRDNGPALIDKYGDNVSCYWYLNGSEFSYEEYRVMMTCLRAVKKFKKNVVKNALYNSKLVCKDVAGMISGYVY